MRRALKALALAVVLSAVLWLAGLAIFAASLPDSVEQPERVTEAIVVLTGGSERLDTGLALLREGRGVTLFVSGVHRQVVLHDILSLSEDFPEDLTDRIVLGYTAGNTVGNAAETAAWMRERGYRSLRLVTSNYHMPRSMLELRSSMPEAEILAHPVFPAHVKQDEWWRWRGTATLIATEYSKFLAARLRLWLGMPRTS